MLLVINCVVLRTVHKYMYLYMLGPQPCMCMYARQCIWQLLKVYLRRKRRTDGWAAESRSKQPKSVQVRDRDIVCLPKTELNNISYPRGKFHTKLGERGLIGKIRLTSTMTEEEVEAEV